MIPDFDATKLNRVYITGRPERLAAILLWVIENQCEIFLEPTQLGKLCGEVVYLDDMFAKKMINKYWGFRRSKIEGILWTYMTDLDLDMMILAFGPKEIAKAN